MKYYLIAGEASGDLHASNLMKALKNHDSSAEFRFWGGDKMKTVGGELVQHFKDISYMGFWEVFTHLFEIKKKLKQCKQDVISYNPDALILVDYPGFNLRMAKWASRKGIKVFYYISPQVWAWKRSRVHQIKKTVDRMFVILPFEKDFYREYDYEVDFVGHPLLDTIRTGSDGNAAGERYIIAIVPGSRAQEISRMLPVMVNLKPHYPNHEFVIAGVSSVSDEIYKPHLDSQNDVKVEYDNMDGVLSRNGR